MSTRSIYETENVSLPLQSPLANFLSQNVLSLSQSESLVALPAQRAAVSVLRVNHSKTSAAVPLQTIATDNNKPVRALCWLPLSPQRVVSLLALTTSALELWRSEAHTHTHTLSLSLSLSLVRAFPLPAALGVPSQLLSVSLSSSKPSGLVLSAAGNVFVFSLSLSSASTAAEASWREIALPQRVQLLHACSRGSVLVVYRSGESEILSSHALLRGNVNSTHTHTHTHTHTLTHTHTHTHTLTHTHTESLESTQVETSNKTKRENRSLLDVGAPGEEREKALVPQTATALGDFVFLSLSSPAVSLTSTLFHSVSSATAKSSFTHALPGSSLADTLFVERRATVEASREPSLSALMSLSQQAHLSAVELDATQQTHTTREPQPFVVKTFLRTESKELSISASHSRPSPSLKERSSLTLRGALSQSASIHCPADVIASLEVSDAQGFVAIASSAFSSAVKVFWFDGSAREGEQWREIDSVTLPDKYCCRGLRLLPQEDEKKERTIELMSLSIRGVEEEALRKPPSLLMVAASRKERSDEGESEKHLSSKPLVSISTTKEFDVELWHHWLPVAPSSSLNQSTVTVSHQPTKPSIVVAQEGESRPEPVDVLSPRQSRNNAEGANTQILAAIERVAHSFENRFNKIEDLLAAQSFSISALQRDMNELRRHIITKK